MRTWPQRAEGEAAIPNTPSGAQCQASNPASSFCTDLLPPPRPIHRNPDFRQPNGDHGQPLIHKDRSTLMRGLYAGRASVQTSPESRSGQSCSIGLPCGGSGTEASSTEDRFFSPCPVLTASTREPDSIGRISLNLHKGGDRYRCARFQQNALPSCDQPHSLGDRASARERLRDGGARGGLHRDRAR